MTRGGLNVGFRPLPQTTRRHLRTAQAPTLGCGSRRRPGSAGQGPVPRTVRPCPSHRHRPPRLLGDRQLHEPARQVPTQDQATRRLARNQHPDHQGCNRRDPPVGRPTDSPDSWSPDHLVANFLRIRSFPRHRRPPPRKKLMVGCPRNRISSSSRACRTAGSTKLRPELAVRRYGTRVDWRGTLEGASGIRGLYTNVGCVGPSLAAAVRHFTGILPHITEVQAPPHRDASTDRNTRRIRAP